MIRHDPADTECRGFRHWLLMIADCNWWIHTRHLRRLPWWRIWMDLVPTKALWCQGLCSWILMAARSYPLTNTSEKRNADELIMNICSDADARRHQTQSLCSLGAGDVFFSHLTNLTSWATPKRARFGVPKREGSSVATCWDHVRTFWRHWHPQLHVLNVYEHPALFFFCVLGQKNDATLLPHVFIWPRCFHNAALCDPHIGTDHGLTSSGATVYGGPKDTASWSLFHMIYIKFVLKVEVGCLNTWSFQPPLPLTQPDIIADLAYHSRPQHFMVTPLTYVLSKHEHHPSYKHCFWCHTERWWKDETLGFPGANLWCTFHPMVSLAPSWASYLSNYRSILWIVYNNACVFKYVQ